MQHEIIGTPPEDDQAAVRRDFEAFCCDLESTPSKRVSVVFGFAWGNEIYQHDWLSLELTGSELRARVAAAEASGLGRIDSDNLHITLPDLRVTRLYCHEDDVHVVAEDRNDAYLVAQREKWIEAGWDVHPRDVA